MKYSKLDAETIGSMTSEEAQAALDHLAAEFFGNGAWRGDLARYIDAQGRTVRKWMEPGNKPPTMALLLLSAELEARKHRRITDLFAEAINAIS